MAEDSSGQKRSRGFRSLVAQALRPKPARQVLRKRDDQSTTSTQTSSSTTVSLHQVDASGKPQTESTGSADGEPLLSPLAAHRLKYKEIHARLDSQRGEDYSYYQDFTSVLHSLGQTDDTEAALTAGDDQQQQQQQQQLSRGRTYSGETAVARLSPELWAMIARHLNSPKDAASLAVSSKTLLDRLGCEPLAALDKPDNYHFKIDFLTQFDGLLPHHLLCFPCAKYHRRLHEGRESLHAAAQSGGGGGGSSSSRSVVFVCPNVCNAMRPAPRLRITHGHDLPFAFAQLALRAHRFGSNYGIATASLARRWTRNGWTHRSRFHIDHGAGGGGGHLLMRVVSQTFADAGLPPAAQRMLLYSRDDYWPYFSVCAHWRDGDLMDICKCALGHVPQRANTAGLLGVEARMKHVLATATTGAVVGPRKGGSSSNSSGNSLFAGRCARCRPMRRCPECPTEYLVEIKLTETRRSNSNSNSNSSSAAQHEFRHAIVVTRWSDLGDGSSPTGSREWAACNGLADGAGFDSLGELGRRSISGAFESALTHDTIPGQRLVSLNPSGKKLGEAGNDWY